MDENRFLLVNQAKKINDYLLCGNGNIWIFFSPFRAERAPVPIASA
jgi:hypothetical protein